MFQGKYIILLNMYSAFVDNHLMFTKLWAGYTGTVLDKQDEYCSIEIY